MNIEQIAQEVADELFLGGKAVGHEPAEFLRRCLSKLAEQDVEPVACYNPSVDAAEDAFNWYCNTGRSDADYPVALYTEAQLIAAQQRTAEACAKVLRSMSEERLEEVRNKYGVQVARCTLANAAKNISNGKWMEYL